MNTTAKNVFIWIVIIVAVVVLWNFLQTVRTGNVREVNYSEFTSMVKDNKIRSYPHAPVVFTGNEVEGKYVDANNTEQQFRVIIPKGSEETTANTLNEKDIIVKVSHYELIPKDISSWRLGL